MIELFIRFYGQEFQGIRLNQILNAIRQHHSEEPVGSIAIDDCRVNTDVSDGAHT